MEFISSALFGRPACRLSPFFVAAPVGVTDRNRRGFGKAANQ